MLSPRLQGEGLVKVGNPVDLYQGNAKLPGDGASGFPGYISLLLLNVVENFDELVGLALPPLEDGFKELGHVHLLLRIKV
jgi:hypothetical protein